MKDKKVLRSFVMITQIGISMMVPVFLCGVLGRWLSRLTEKDWVFLVLIFIGVGAAFRNFFIVTKSFYEKDMKEEHEKLAYMRDLQNYREEHPEEEFLDVLEGKKKRYPETKGPTRS
ncbi:MAG: AtpZ/AtpI family protein [Lachnospiraceae bacterium]|nr:AtpZ/AtpI family protein [Lachnospiraceae bacterium]